MYIYIYIFICVPAWGVPARGVPSGAQQRSTGPTGEARGPPEEHGAHRMSTGPTGEARGPPEEHGPTGGARGQPGNKFKSFLNNLQHILTF